MRTPTGTRNEWTEETFVRYDNNIKEISHADSIVATFNAQKMLLPVGRMNSLFIDSGHISVYGVMLHKHFKRSVDYNIEFKMSTKFA
jgi:hypothetical protein